ncbi:cystatin-1-like [Crotalus adamanteus]|uniref:Cystatin-1-like n=1 Tax=Crotalus adamanteus TaxID=8729 RepID=A0AAW1AN66_CROAD
MARSQMPCPLVVLCSLLILPTVLLQEVGMPGGLSPASVTDEGVQNAAAFAVEQYNERSDNTNYFKVLRIVKAQIQVQLEIRRAAGVPGEACPCSAHLTGRLSLVFKLGVVSESPSQLNCAFLFSQQVGSSSSSQDLDTEKKAKSCSSP